MPDNDQQPVEAAPDEHDVVLELDELGSLVIDLRTAYDHPAAADVAQQHLEVMLAAFDAATPPDSPTAG